TTLFRSFRNFAAVLGDEPFRERDHVPGFGIEQADGLNVLLEPIFPQFDHLLRGSHLGEQLARRLVDAYIGGLGGKYDCDEELIDVPELELGLRRRIVLGQAAEELEYLGPGQSPSTCLMTQRPAGWPISQAAP